MALPNGGFLIITRFDELYRDYWSRFEKIARNHWGFTGELIYSIPQEGLPPNEVRKKYRGIDRVPLIAWPSRRFPDETWMGREEPRHLKRSTISRLRMERMKDLSCQFGMRVVYIPCFGIRKDGK